MEIITLIYVIVLTENDSRSFTSIHRKLNIHTSLYKKRNINEEREREREREREIKRYLNQVRLELLKFGYLIILLVYPLVSTTYAIF